MILRYLFRRLTIPYLLVLWTLVLFLSPIPALPMLQKGLTGLPNDPSLIEENRTYAPQLLNLFTAWDFPVVKRDVVIAILDTGIAQNHPEFAGRILPGHDFANNDDDPEDDRGHGTHVAGIVAAAVGNGEGVAGVCGFCLILPIKIVTEMGSFSPAGIKEGLEYAADHGADIVLMSLGNTTGSSQITEGIEYARARGLFIVAAAGNDHSATPFYPAAYDGVFAVTATTERDQPWYDSNFGDYIDAAAPGELVYSTHHDLNGENHGYLTMSGTSMAAPFVAGLAGLLLAQNPDRTADDLARLITTSAVDLGEPGWDPVFGHGRIDPVAALAAEAPAGPVTALLQGAVWHDDNQNNIREPEEGNGVPNVELVIRDNQQRIVGLTNTRLNGEWQWTALAPGDYVVNAKLPNTLVATAASTLMVTVAPAQTAPLPMGVVVRPTSDDFQAFDATRFRDQVYLSWQITPLVKTLRVERSASANGVYDVVGSLPIDNPSASAMPVNFVDALPDNLQSTALYYRIQISPGAVVMGPFLVGTESVTHQLFLPLINGQ